MDLRSGETLANLRPDSLRPVIHLRNAANVITKPFPFLRREEVELDATISGLGKDAKMSIHKPGEPDESLVDITPDDIQNGGDFWKTLQEKISSSFGFGRMDDLVKAAKTIIQNKKSNINTTLADLVKLPSGLGALVTLEPAGTDAVRYNILDGGTKYSLSSNKTTLQGLTEELMKASRAALNTRVERIDNSTAS